jgi:predicted nucleic acid-binding protein
VTFLDTNVVLDVLYNDAAWKDWSLDAILAAPRPRRIAPVVYSELSGRYEARTILDEELALLEIELEEPTRDALYQAGRAHAAYRRQGGTRMRVLPDFLIGAQAADRGAKLITRDTGRYRATFPDVEIVCPETP